MHRSNNRSYLFIIFILLVVNIAMAWFFFWYKPARRERDRIDIAEMLKKEVGFNEEQLKQFEVLYKQHHENLKPLFDSVRKAKEQFYQLLLQPQVSDSLKNAKAVVIGEKQQALDMAVYNNFLEIKKLCTPEQQPKFDSTLQQVVKRMISYPRKNRQNKPPAAP
jgi:Spy/CpxP family protein refolding chaperone